MNLRIPRVTGAALNFLEAGQNLEIVAPGDVFWISSTSAEMSSRDYEC